MTRSAIRYIAPVLGAALIASGLTGAAQAEGLFQSRTMTMAQDRLAKSFEVLDRKQIREQIREQFRTQDRTMTQDRAMTQDRTMTQERSRSAAATSASAGGRSGGGAGGGNGSPGRN